jgi:hypothetical protein
VRNAKKRGLKAEQARRTGGGSTAARKNGRRGAGHPLLELQRSAGNMAVAELVQREQKRKKDYSPALALASPEELYEGKADADLSAPTVRKKSSPGLTGRETKVIFECGPESFEFRTFRGWLDSDRFPWDVETVDEDPAWVVAEISSALDDIVGDIDEPGAKFWNGYHTIQSTLKTDLVRYNRD